MRRHNTPRHYIVKQDSTSTQDNTNMTTTSYEEDSTQEGGRPGFESIVTSQYKRPRGGTKQENFDSDDIKKRLEGFVQLKSMQDKKVLTDLPLFKTWVKYINKDTRQYRSGGLLMKVVYPEYIMLVNTAKNLTWSVQLRDNHIFIRDPAENNGRNKKENEIKDKLYSMYKRGELNRRHE